MSLDSLCNKTVSYYRSTDTVNDIGASKRSYSALHTGIRCTIQDAPGHIQERFARRNIVVTHRIYSTFAFTNPPRADDKLIDNTGATYLVKSYMDMGGRGTHYCLYAEKVN